MPGIAGVASASLTGESFQHAVKAMQDRITHRHFYVKDKVTFYGGCCGARSHINAVQTSPQPFSENNMHVWLDGELYRWPDRPDSGYDAAVSDVQLIHRLYTRSHNFKFLREIDGSFAAVIYDETSQKINLVSDRIGREHLYWTRYKQGIAWSSELKAFTSLPGFDAKIDADAVEEYLVVGNQLGERTWFRGVQLLPAATVLTFDLKSQETETSRYWWWDEIRPFTADSDSLELADEAGNLLIDAVERMSHLSEEPVGIALSGGRDSRALFAAMPQKTEPIHAITVGQPNCLDIRVASNVVKLKKGIHHISEIHAGSWFASRLENIWLTDGQTSLIHLNSGNFISEEEPVVKIVLNGLAGELIGGKARPFEMHQSREYLNKTYPELPEDSELKMRLQQYITDAGCPEAYAVNYRFRNFSSHGVSRGEATGYKARLPFFDRDYMDFVHRIPHEYKRSAKMYDTMLLLKFPEYFPDLSWKYLDHSVGIMHKLKYFRFKAGNKIIRLAAKRGLMADIPKHLANFEVLLRSNPAKKLIESVLSDPEALHADYVDRNQVLTTLNDHMEGRNYTDKLALYTTLEIWLQQIFNNKYRDYETITLS